MSNEPHIKAINIQTIKGYVSVKAINIQTIKGSVSVKAINIQTFTSELFTTFKSTVSFKSATTIGA